ncbi:acyl-CoA dehydrogenase family protein [Terribacillus sp. DMT04]|uniref:acyl-CoA dehydrogenase family protein n=1 Tax=Terribacillus sp. DMT04 TaxID=2850441 RepID=UPI001C2BDF73|nr:acyl-CoA dehydrogenase [Terribacillus sp. DMT04]QXE00832.1 acyl-CoA dehydrogenase [Terribacillus sp. DMT04]
MIFPSNVHIIEKASKVADVARAYKSIGDEQARLAEKVIDTFRSAAYTLLTIPNEQGGDGANLHDFLLAQETLAAGDGAAALSIGWHLSTMQDLCENANWPAGMFSRFLQEVVQKKKIVNRAASEPATGSPTRGGIPETHAKRVGDGYILNGRKTFTSMAADLDYYLVTAYAEEEDTVGSFLIAREIKGVSVEKTWNPMGMRATGSDDLVLENVHVPAEYFVEKTKTKSGPKGSLLHIPACYLGIAKSARDEAIQFAQKFQPNTLDTPIIHVPHIREKIGEMDLELMQARHFMYHVASLWDSFPEKRHQMAGELAAVKVNATKAAVKVVDLAMRIAGGRGLAKNQPFEQHYRDVRAGLHNPPMDDAVVELLASQAANSKKR